MTMPVMEPDLDAEVLRDWARAIDDGPFSSLCWGERMAFDNPETLTLMGALAAWTDRVRLVTTVMVPQLHDPVMLAKAGVTDRETLKRRCHKAHRRVSALLAEYNAAYARNRARRKDGAAFSCRRTHSLCW
jgi:Luciferase-like monooxygenase